MLKFLHRSCLRERYLPGDHDASYVDCYGDHLYSYDDFYSFRHCCNYDDCYGDHLCSYDDFYSFRLCCNYDDCYADHLCSYDDYSFRHCCKYDDCYADYLCNYDDFYIYHHFCNYDHFYNYDHCNNYESFLYTLYTLYILYILFSFTLSDPLRSKCMLLNTLQQPNSPPGRRDLVERRLQAQVLRKFCHCSFHRFQGHNQRCHVPSARLQYHSAVGPKNLWYRSVWKWWVASFRASTWIW